MPIAIAPAVACGASAWTTGSSPVVTSAETYSAMPLAEGGASVRVREFLAPAEKIFRPAGAREEGVGGTEPGFRGGSAGA